MGEPGFKLSVNTLYFLCVYIKTFTNRCFWEWSLREDVFEIDHGFLMSEPRINCGVKHTWVKFTELEGGLLEFTKYVIGYFFFIHIVKLIFECFKRTRVGLIIDQVHLKTLWNLHLSGLGLGGVRNPAARSRSLRSISCSSSRAKLLFSFELEFVTSTPDCRTNSLTFWLMLLYVSIFLMIVCESKVVVVTDQIEAIDDWLVLVQTPLIGYRIDAHLNISGTEWTSIEILVKLMVT